MYGQIARGQPYDAKMPALGLAKASVLHAASSAFFTFALFARFSAVVVARVAKNYSRQA